METNDTIQETMNIEEFEKNLQQQEEDFRRYLSEHDQKTKFPMEGYAYSEFWSQYWHFRACVASLQKNPDTKDDKDFCDLCTRWRNITSPFYLRQKDFDELEQKYRLLGRKPVFGGNPFYQELYGAFVKSIYGLITGACADYWTGFFDLD